LGLPNDIRHFIETRLNRDLRNVRVHYSGGPSKLARHLGARAFTIGSHIAFRDTCVDALHCKHIWLLAHELAHFIQQNNGRFISGLEGVDFDALEEKANAVADLVAAGRSVPLDFDFGVAPYGAIQCHADDECQGTRYNASLPEIWMAANEAIELAYKNDPRLRNNSVFFGSDFDNSLLKIGPEGPRYGVPNHRPLRAGIAEVGLPKGVKEKRFGNILLQELRGLERQRRPDIIDFTNRVFYEIKSTGYEDRGQVQLQSYYKITEQILHHHGQMEPPWKLDTSPPWYPPHTLTMLNPDPTVELVVCTQATDHQRYPGMILYEVRRLPRRRRRRRTNEIRMWDFWPEFDSFRQTAKAELPKAIRYHDPSSPDYVIIVPHEFFQLPGMKQLTDEMMQPRWDKFRVQPEIARRRLIIDPRVTQFWLGVVCIVGMAAIIVVTAGVAAPAAGVGGAVAVETGVGAVTAVETTAVTTTASAGIQSSIIVPSAMAAQVAGTTAVVTTVETVSLSTFNAMLASSAVKGIAATAGVLLIIGTANTANAATKVPNIDNVIAFRVIPINDFTEKAGQMYANSGADVPDNMYTAKDFKDKFPIGRKVFYDSKQHWIFSQVSAK
jgi:hypothetical protein